MERQLDKIKASGVVAGVHTVEVKAKQADYRDRETGRTWDYVSNHYQQYGEHVIVLNPHKANLTPEGKFKCLYGDRAGIDAAIAQAAQEMQWSDDWRFSRIDFCFDLQCPYMDSDKLVRLFLLMVAKSAELENRYSSIDPASLEWKTTRVSYDKRNTSQQAEHYNRALLEQEDFDAKVINRLEFRTSGLALTNCDGERNMRAPVDLWLGIIDKAMTKENLEAVEDEAAQAFYRQWLKERAEGDMEQITQYIRANARWIYTRRQLERILMLDLESKGISAADSKAKAKRSSKSLLDAKKNFRLGVYVLPDLEELAALLWNAAEEYFKG